MNKYQIIYADPPWRYKRKGKYCAGRYYETMSVKEIEELKVREISEDNSILWLWTTNSFLHDAFHIIEKWGFGYKTCLTWKKNHFGLGYWLWGQTEHCLLSVRGKHKRIIPPIATTILEAVKSKHSKKPEQMYEIIERMPYKPRIELFARSKREGWDSWGNEIKSDVEL